MEKKTAESLSLELDGHYYYALLRIFLRDIMDFNKREFEEFLSNGFADDIRDVRTIKKFERDDRKTLRLKNFNLSFLDLYREHEFKETAELKEFILNQNPTCESCQKRFNSCQPFRKCIICDSCAQKGNCALKQESGKSIVNCTFFYDICALIDDGLHTRYLFCSLDSYPPDETNIFYQLDGTSKKLLTYFLKRYPNIEYWFNLCKFSDLLVGFPSDVYSFVLIPQDKAKGLLSEIKDGLPSISGSKIPFELMDSYRQLENLLPENIELLTTTHNISNRALVYKLEESKICRIDIWRLLKLYQWLLTYPVRKVDIQLFMTLKCLHSPEKQQEYGKKILEFYKSLGDRRAIGKP